MGKRTMGIARTENRTDVELNDIFTHPKVAEKIFEYLYPHLPAQVEYILDACCGYNEHKGVLSNAIQKYISAIHKVECQDIKLNGVSILDFETICKYDIIVCNPPFTPVDRMFAIYKKLMSLLSEKGVLFFFCRNDFVYQGIDRAKELQFQKYYFLPRYAYLSSERPLLDVGILVYNKIPTFKALQLKPFIDVPKIKPNYNLNLF